MFTCAVERFVITTHAMTPPSSAYDVHGGARAPCAWASAAGAARRTARMIVATARVAFSRNHREAPRSVGSGTKGAT